ncbi:MAG: NAD(+)/NADH kinase [Minisyncoccia bacterium]
MPNKQIQKISFYSRIDNTEAKHWQSKILEWLKDNYPNIAVEEEHSDAVIVLGGDGAIMEASRMNAKSGAVIVGINLGNLGFLSSINNPIDFPLMLEKLFKGDFQIHKGMLVKAVVIRDGKEVFSAEAFNEVVVESPLGMVELDVVIDGEVVEEIRGSGALVATPFGSTAYNLSAHGPIVSPNIECLIVTELFDHDIPSPSLVIPTTETIKLVVQNFRENKLLKISATNEPVDVLLIADGQASFVLKQKDEVNITKTDSSFSLAILEHNHFFKSLRSKFSFK